MSDVLNNQGGQSFEPQEETGAQSEKNTTKIFVGNGFTQTRTGTDNMKHPLGGYAGISLSVDEFKKIADSLKNVNKDAKNVNLFVRKRQDWNEETGKFDNVKIDWNKDLAYRGNDLVVYMETDPDRVKTSGQFVEYSIRLDINKIDELSRAGFTKKVDTKNGEKEYINLNIQPRPLSNIKFDQMFQVTFVKDRELAKNRPTKQDVADGNVSQEEYEQYFKDNVVSVGTGKTQNQFNFNVQYKDITVDNVQNLLDSQCRHTVELLAKKYGDQFVRIAKDLTINESENPTVTSVLKQANVPYNSKGSQIADLMKETEKKLQENFVQKNQAKVEQKAEQKKGKKTAPGL